MSQPPEIPLAATGVRSLYTGVNYHASCERAYNADGTVYSNAGQLRQVWNTFVEESTKRNRRRALMRCFVSRNLLDQLSDLPIEAAVPVGKEFLIWIGQNQHEEVAMQRAVQNVPQAAFAPLSSRYHVDTQVTESDIGSLVELWGQFGWTQDGVQNFVRNNANGNPIALIRTMEQEAVGVMIAESVEFGSHRLVEITELAVNPNHRGQHLATILIRELSRLSLEKWEDALVFGEYCVTTRSFQSAAKAGSLPGQTSGIRGVLRDHVAIETGTGNAVVKPWDTRWLHNFLVMYQPNRRLR